jgi:hypothetical protein
METEVRFIGLVYEVYHVVDNKGVHHLYNDRLAAQMAEERYQREKKEIE